MCDRQSKPGPICGARLDSLWIDAGTHSRWRSHRPGPLRSIPKPSTAIDRPVERATFSYAIDIIAASPFAATTAGRHIVHTLRELNRSGRIHYAGHLGDVRGETDGHTIWVNDGYAKNVARTATTLVHEASHVVRPAKNGRDPAVVDAENAADEFDAELNELEIYKYLRSAKHWPEDSLLEFRLDRARRNTLETAVRNAMTRPL
jgi:hypothetical protein